MRLYLLALSSLFAAANLSAQNAALDAKVDQELPSLVSTYKALHAAPELSHHEDKTAAMLASELRGFGYDVTEHVGKYPNPQWQGQGGWLRLFLVRLLVWVQVFEKAARLSIRLRAKCGAPCDAENEGNR